MQGYKRVADNLREECRPVEPDARLRYFVTSNYVIYWKRNPAAAWPAKSILFRLLPSTSFASKFAARSNSMASTEEETNPYELLGVTMESTEKEIKTAYRLRSLKVHPDRVSILIQFNFRFKLSMSSNSSCLVKNRGNPDAGV